MQGSNDCQGSIGEVQNVNGRCNAMWTSEEPSFLAVIQTKKYSDFFGMSGNFVQICFVVDEPVMRESFAKFSSISATF